MSLLNPDIRLLRPTKMDRGGTPLDPTTPRGVEECTIVNLYVTDTLSHINSLKYSLVIY